MVVLSYYATEGPRIMYYTALLFIMYVLCIMYYATLRSTGGFAGNLRIAFFENLLISVKDASALRSNFCAIWVAHQCIGARQFGWAEPLRVFSLG